MKTIVNLALRLWFWIKSWFSRRARPLQTVYLKEIPETLAPAEVYVLGEGSHKWFVAMLCPCGCGDSVEVSLLPDAEPRWSLTEHRDTTISLMPSIWRRSGCKSHFFLRRGLIEWCGNGNGSLSKK